MAIWEPDEIDYEDQYDKADPIDDADLDASINELNRSIKNRKNYKKSLVRLNGNRQIKMNERSWNNR